LNLKIALESVDANLLVTSGSKNHYQQSFTWTQQHLSNLENY